MPSLSKRPHLTVWGSPGDPTEIPVLGLWLQSDGLPWLGHPNTSNIVTPGLDLEESLEASMLNIGDVLAGKALDDWAFWSGALPLESGMEDELKADTAEEALAITLPSLKQICAQPRSHLRSDEQREIISRVRKTSPRSLPLLAARSEDWQARTFRGVRPARLLAANNEDDWEIYENRVVVTLHRRLVAALSLRIARLRTLLAQIEAAEEAGKTNMAGSWRRRHRLSRLLGEVFENPPQADEIRALCVRLATMLSRLRGLENSFLVKTLRHSRSVQSPLIQTNLLRSDLAYRKTARLWEHWMNRREIVKPSRREIRSRLIASHQRFTRVLFFRALAAMGLRPLGGAQTPNCINLNRGWRLGTTSGGVIELWRHSKCVLRIAAIAVDWHKLSDADAARWWASLARLAQGTPTLCISLQDALQDNRVKWSDYALKLFQDAECFGFLTTGLGLINASPRQLDSSEGVLRFLRTVVHREEWPLLPVSVKLGPGANSQGVRAELPSSCTLHEGAARFAVAPTRAEMLDIQHRVQSSEKQLRHLQSELERIDIEIKDHSIDGSVRARRRAEKIEVSSRITDEVRRVEFRRSAASALNEAYGLFLVACMCPIDPHHRGKLTPGRTFVCEECKAEWGRMPSSESSPAFILPKGLSGTESHQELVQLWGADVITPVGVGSNGRIGSTFS